MPGRRHLYLALHLSPFLRVIQHGYGSGKILYQSLDPNSTPSGRADTISNGGAEGRFPYISRSRIVYTPFEAPGQDRIVLYQIVSEGRKPPCPTPVLTPRGGSMGASLWSWRARSARPGG